jgi:hypothetical protein
MTHIPQRSSPNAAEVDQSTHVHSTSTVLAYFEAQH